ncbi:response regulator transcription factor [Kribbella sp. NPDC051718]|uniref:response regulator transcription factor n=1 Tax=Kribbella sp. NPDC051718 TaxID=3155168 RepID=UPI003449A979
MSSPESSPARVVVIEDETLQRESQEKLVGPGFEIVGSFPSVEAFLDALPAADMVLLDLWIRPPRAESAPPLRGLRAVEAIVARQYRILIYTADRRREVLARLLRAGAHGVVIKTEPKDLLLRAIARVGAGEVVLTTELTGLAELYEREGLLPTLTPREQEVLRWRARGLSVESIMARLFLSRSAIEKYTTETNRKFRDYLARVDLDELVPESSTSAAVLANTLGYGPDDLLDPNAPPAGL